MGTILKKSVTPLTWISEVNLPVKLLQSRQVENNVHFACRRMCLQHSLLSFQGHQGQAEKESQRCLDLETKSEYSWSKRPTSILWGWGEDGFIGFSFDLLKCIYQVLAGICTPYTGKWQNLTSSHYTHTTSFIPHKMSLHDSLDHELLWRWNTFYRSNNTNHKKLALDIKARRQWLDTWMMPPHTLNVVSQMDAMVEGRRGTPDEPKSLRLIKEFPGHEI